MSLYERATELFELRSDGTLVHRQTRGRAVAGRIAGCIHKATGYLCVSIDGKQHFAHRIVWLLVT